MGWAVAATFRERRTLLIADDDAGLRATLEDVFERHFEVRAAGSGREALALLDRDPADAALFDVQMGEVSGLDVLREVRDRRLRLPCLLMTARPTDEVIARAGELGAAPVLCKPFGLAQVVEAVRALFERTYGLAACPWSPS